MEPLAFATEAAAGHQTFISAHGTTDEQLPVPFDVFHVTFSWYREFGLNEIANCPVPSKYNVFAVPKTIPNCAEVFVAVGIARRSATTAAIMFVAAV